MNSRVFVSYLKRKLYLKLPNLEVIYFIYMYEISIMHFGSIPSMPEQSFQLQVLTTSSNLAS